jgi:diguanylate cyclase (GGDEF)-like protein/PAS domain S-box-containing protein
MSGTSDGTSGGVRQRGRAATPIALLGLALVMGATSLLAFNRFSAISDARDSSAAAAHQEFVIEVESSRQTVTNELDRLSELMMGISAFVAVSDDRASVAVDRYLELTGAPDRFGGFIESHVISPANPNAPRTAFETEILEAIAKNPDRTPVLTAHTHPLHGAVTVLSFHLDTRLLRPWGSLVFATDSFLARGVTAASALRTSLVNTATPVDGATATYAPGDTIPIAIDGAGRLTAAVNIDVFGTNFEIGSTASPNLFEAPGYLPVWILLAAGSVGAGALFLALQTLSRARASAVAEAETSALRLAAMDERFQASFDRAPIGMAELDHDGLIVAVNPALCRQIGKQATVLEGRLLSSFVHQPDRGAHHERLSDLLEGVADACEGEHRFRHDDGTDVWVHESVSTIAVDGSHRRSLLVQSQDTTAHRKAAWDLAQQALHDELTGLPNRALFLNRLRHALVRTQRNATSVAVMFVDIDRFKVINDSMGHDVGDQLLVQIAERLSRATRSGDTVARFGGDEFVVLVDNVSGDSEAAAAAQRIQGVFSKPYMLGETPTYTTASIGVSLSSPGDASADALLRDADAAMYRAKDEGRNRAELFDQSMRSNLVARMEIESQLRSALQNGEILMHYQAIVEPETYTPVGYEALIRWNHPEKGLLGPAAFLGVAEEAGLIDLVDTFALRSVCRQIATWVEAYPAAKDIYLATNWSARHLGRFVQQVEQTLAETGINPRQLVIEVTEGFLLEDSDASVLALQRLKRLGVQIAIDDFGTGYSSLSYLTQFAVDYLKIDQSFVSQLPESEASAAVIGAIADLATRLGIKLVAEGVETDEQIAVLASLGSPRLQGYRFAKPRPAADIATQLEALSTGGRRTFEMTGAMAGTERTLAAAATTS